MTSQDRTTSEPDPAGARPGPRRPSRRRLTTGVATLLVATSAVVGASPAPEPAEAAPAIAWEDTSPSGLARTGDADPSTLITVRFGLRRADLAGLEAAAKAVSDPTSPFYGQHLPLGEVDRRFGAPAADRTTLVDALADRGITAAVNVTGGHAAAPMTVEEASDLFNTPWGTYGSGDDAVALPDDPPSLSPPLADVVDLVTGLVPEPPTALGDAQRAAAASQGSGASSVYEGGTPLRTGTPEGCDAAIDAPGLSAGAGKHFGLLPNELADAYGLSDLRAGGVDGSGMRVAVVGFGAPDTGDLGTYADCFGLDTAAVSIFSEPGTATSGGAATEATLDVQALLSAAPGLDRLDLYALAGAGGLDSFVEMLEAPLEAAANGRPLPHLVSVSYGVCEAVWEGDPVRHLTEQVLAGASLAGVGYQVASGDNGSSDCIQAADDTREAVDYPAASAWATAIGGTNITLDDANTITSQGVWNDDVYPPLLADLYPDAAGGGGTSIAIDRPDHQRAQGLSSGPTRVVPDIALLGDPLPGYVIYCDAACAGKGGWRHVGGTSASTPLATGALALVGQRLGQVRDAGADGVRLGLVAPLIWELGRQGDTGALRDVTIGDNDVAGVGCCDAGPGFDLATGWGSVDAGGLAAALGAVPVDLTTQVGPTGDGGEAPVRLAASATPPAGSVLSWTWTVDGDDVATTSSPTLELGLDPGPHAVEVAARTNLGATGSGTGSVEVPAGGPLPDADPASPVPAPASFTG